MTDSDPWAVADAQPASTRPQDTSSSLAGSYEPEEQQSSLFRPTIETLPSLFTAAHPPMTTIRGTILAKPRDVQSTCHPSKSPDRQSRLKEYWVTDLSSGKRVPGLAAVDPVTGKPNDPVMNLVVSVQTDERDPQIEGDDGRRSWFVSGVSKAPRGHKVGDPVLSSRLALLDALQLAAASGIKLTGDKDLIGLNLSVSRLNRENPNVGTSPWFWQARITKD